MLVEWCAVCGWQDLSDARLPQCYSGPSTLFSYVLRLCLDLAMLTTSEVRWRVEAGTQSFDAALLPLVGRLPTITTDAGFQQYLGFPAHKRPFDILYC